MNRRQFLKSCVYCVGAVAIPSCLLPVKSSMPPEIYGQTTPIVPAYFSQDWKTAPTSIVIDKKSGTYKYISPKEAEEMLRQADYLCDEWVKRLNLVT